MSASSLRRLSPGSTTTATTTTAAVAMIDDDIDLGNIEDILRESAEQEEASMISGSSATGGGGGGASSGSPFSSSGRDPTSRSATSDYISAFAANGTLDDKPYCNSNPSTATTTSTASAFTTNLLPGGIGSSSNTATTSSRPLLPSSWSGGLSDATATSTTTTPTGGANNANKTTTMKATTTTTTTAAGGGGGVKSQMQVTSKPFFPSTAAPAWSSASPSSPSAATQHNTSNNSTSYSTRSYVSADGGGNNAGGNGGGGHWNGHHHRDPNSPASEGGNSHTAAAAGRSQWSNNNNGYNGNNGTSSSHHHHQHYNNNGSSHNSSLNMSGSGAVRGGGGGGSTTATPSHYRSGVSSMNNSSYMMTSHHDRSGTSNRNGDGGATNASSLSGTPIPHHRAGGGGTPTSSHFTAREPIPFETYLPFEGIKYWAADHFCVVINNLEPKTTSRHLNTMFFPLGAVDAVAFAMPIGEEDTFRMYQGRKGGVAMFSTAEIGQMAAEKIDDFVPNGQTQPLRTFYFGRYEDYAKRGKNAFYVRIRDNLTVKNPDLWRNIDILCVTFQEAIGFSEEEATDAGLLLMEAVERDPERYFSIAVHICRVVSGVPLKHSSAFFTAVSRGVIQRGVTGKGASLMFREAAAVLCALLFDLKVLKGGTPFPMANKLCKDLTAKAARLREKELLVGSNNEEIHAGGAGVSANRGLSLGSNHSDHTLCALVTMCSNWAARNMSRETNTPEEIEFRDQIRQIARAGFGGPQILQYAEDALSDTQRRYRCGWELEELSEEESSSSDEDSFGDEDDDSSDDEEDDYLAGNVDMESDDDLPLAAVDDYRKEQDHQHNLQLRQYHQLNESGGTPTTEGDDGSGQSTPRRDRSVRGAGLMFTGAQQQQSPSSPAAVTPNTSIDASFQTFNSQTPEKVGAANNNISCDSASFSVSAGSQPTPIKAATSAVNTSGTTSHFNNALTNANANNNTYYAGSYENNSNNNTGGDSNNAAAMAAGGGGGVAERLSSILNRTVYMTKVPVHLPNAVLRRVFMTFGELSKVRVYDGERSLSHEGAKYTGNQCHLPHPPPPPHPQTASSSSSPAATTTTTTAAASGDEFSVSSGGLVGGSSSSASQLPPPPPLGPPPTGSYPPHFVAGTNVPLAVTRGSFGFVEFSSSSSAKAMVDFFRNPTVAVSKTFALGEDAEKAVLLMRVSFARSAIHDNEPHDAIIVPISAKHQRKMQKRLFGKECQKKIAAAAEKVAAAAALPTGTTRRIPAGLVLANLGGGATASSTSLTDAASVAAQGGPTAADMVVPRSKRIKRCTFGLGGIY